MYTTQCENKPTLLVMNPIPFSHNDIMLRSTVDVLPTHIHDLLSLDGLSVVGVSVKIYNVYFHLLMVRVLLHETGL